MKCLRFSIALVLILCTLLLASCSGGGKWYLEHETDFAYELPEVPSDMRGYSVYLPLTQTAKNDQLEITVEFFQEKYKLGGIIQARFTVKNISDADLYVSGKNSTYHGAMFRNDGKIFECRIIDINEMAKEDADNISCRKLAAGESYACERIYIADPDFFNPDSTYTMKFSKASYLSPEDFDGMKNSKICELKVDVKVAK